MRNCRPASREKARSFSSKAMRNFGHNIFAGTEVPVSQPEFQVLKGHVRPGPLISRR